MSAALRVQGAAGLRGGRRTWGFAGEAAAGSGSDRAAAPLALPRHRPRRGAGGGTHGERARSGAGAVTAGRRRTPADRGLRAPPPPHGQPEAASPCSPRGDGRVP